MLSVFDRTLSKWFRNFDKKKILVVVIFLALLSLVAYVLSLPFLNQFQQRNTATSAGNPGGANNNIPD